MATDQKKLTILDGGMGHTLRRLGVAVTGEVGSSQRFSRVALANADQPNTVVAAHLAFLEAGANVITVNNYGIVPNTLRLTEADEDGTIGRLMSAAVDCAVQARAQYYNDKVGHNDGSNAVRIAASVPPLNASYRPDQVGLFEENLAVYRHLVREVVRAAQPEGNEEESKIDLFLCETLSTVDEARAAATAVALEGEGRPLWVSWTLAPEGRLRSGETVAAAVDGVVQALMENHCAHLFQAALFNCCTVEAIDQELDGLVARVPEGCAVGAYPNGFAEQRLGVGKNTKSASTTATKETKECCGANNEYRDDLSPSALTTVAQGWVDRGVTIVGGCCGIFPEHIQEMSSSLQKKNEVDVHFLRDHSSMRDESGRSDEDVIVMPSAMPSAGVGKKSHGKSCVCM